MTLDRSGASDRRHGDRDTSRSIGHDVVMPADGKRVPFDSEEYTERTRTNSCFVCRLASNSYGEHVVYRDDHHIAFLPRFHVQLGYVLVAPLEHREAVADDFTTDEYLSLQAVVHRIARALAYVVPTERIYVASLGSQQGNAHVHWHIAALPPGVAFEDQQFRAMMPETRGVLDLAEADRDRLAAGLRAAISR